MRSTKKNTHSTALHSTPPRGSRRAKLWWQLYQVCYKPGDLHLNDESKLQLWKEDTLCNCVGEARMSWDSSFLKRKVRSKGKVDETKEIMITSFKHMHVFWHNWIIEIASSHSPFFFAHQELHLSLSLLLSFSLSLSPSLLLSLSLLLSFSLSLSRILSLKSWSSVMDSWFCLLPFGEPKPPLH